MGMVMCIHFFILVAFLMNGSFQFLIFDFFFIFYRRLLHATSVLFSGFCLFDHVFHMGISCTAIYCILNFLNFNRLDAGLRWVLFFQDTNGLLFKVCLLKCFMNFLCYLSHILIALIITHIFTYVGSIVYYVYFFFFFICMYTCFDLGNSSFFGSQCYKRIPS